jgi:hypothetical protein
MGSAAVRSRGGASAATAFSSAGLERGCASPFLRKKDRAEMRASSGRLFVGGDQGKRGHRLARHRGGDAIEQGQGGAPGLAVGAAQALANGIGGGRGRARGQDP